MKKTILVTLILLALVACATFLRPSLPGVPGVVTVVAQSIPVTKTLAWDANPASDAVTNYVVRLDGVVIGSPTGTSQPVTFTSVGVHTLSVIATNLWGDSAPGTLTVNVVAPGQPAGLRVQ